jgi:hypothetical protein
MGRGGQGRGCSAAQPPGGVAGVRRQACLGDPGRQGVAAQMWGSCGLPAVANMRGSYPAHMPYVSKHP